MAVATKNKDLVADASQLTGAQKAAVFIITVGKQTASEMMKCLKQKEVEQIKEKYNVSPTQMKKEN